MPKSDNKKTLVLFDVGGVLVKLNFSKFYNEVIKLSKNISVDEFKKRFSNEIQKYSLTGNLALEEYFEKLRGIISSGKYISNKEFEDLFAFALGESIDEIIKLKKRIYEAGYSVGIFSNIDDIALKIIKQMDGEVFETYDKSNPVIYSHEVGHTKIDKEMYEKISGYDRIVYIDDNENYLKIGIEKFSWYGILFTEYIDDAEAIRLVHNDKTRPEKNFKIANNIGGLENALREFGIKI